MSPFLYPDGGRRYILDSRRSSSILDFAASTMIDLISGWWPSAMRILAASNIGPLPSWIVASVHISAQACMLGTDGRYATHFSASVSGRWSNPPIHHSIKSLGCQDRIRVGDKLLHMRSERIEVVTVQYAVARGGQKPRLRGKHFGCAVGGAD